MRMSSLRPFAAVVPLLLVVACSSEDASAPVTTVPSPGGRPPDGGADASDPSAVEGGGFTTPNETPGSRLKPLYRQLAGTDGSVKLELAAWFDTGRDEACTFQTMADGNSHCAPYGEEPALNRDAFFQDAACSMPVIAFHRYTSDFGKRCHDPSPFTKRYARIGSARSCSATRLAAFPTTGRLAVSTVYQKMPNGACTAFSLGGEPYEVFASPAPLEEIDPAAFVAMTVADDTPATGKRLRISRTIRTGSDGSRSISSERIVDAERNEFCWSQIDQNGEHRCMPPAGSLSSESGFSNAGCTERAWSIANNANCEDDGRYAFSRYMAKTDYAACLRTSIFPRFTSYPVSRLYYGTPASCSSHSVPTDATAGYFYFSSQPLPPAISPSAFSRIEETERDAPNGYYGKSGSRLVLRQFGQSSPDGFESLQYMTHYDRQLEARCHPATLQDGKTYCVGAYTHFTFGPAGGVFADAACTVGVVGVPKPNPSCGPDAAGVDAKFFAGRPYSQNGCETIRLYNVGARQSFASLYSRDQNGVCAPSYYKPSDYDVYRVSDLSEVTPSTFVGVTSTFIE